MPAWWIERINAAIPKELTHPEIAGRVAAATGWKTDASSISRCLSGKQPTLELILPLSDLFGVPRPVVIARTELEAFALASVTARVDAQLKDVDAQLAVAKAGVPDPSTKAQTVLVHTEHERRAGRRRPRRTE